MTYSKHKITIIGTGYVGLTTGACFASLGHEVICVDNDQDKIDGFAKGLMPIYEEGLSEIVQREMSLGRLKFTTDAIAGVADTEFVFLCLPTPPDKDGFADISAIRKVVMQIRDHLKDGTIVVNKSTVPVNSASIIQELLGNLNIDVVSNPEFLREGSAIADFLNPDRVVIGCNNPISGEKVASLYLDIRCPVIVTDCSSAESIKYLANAFLAMKLSFVNQASGFCDAVGADILEVTRGLGFDPRIGDSFLTPGPGWGGSCFPKDTKALVAIAKFIGQPMTLIEEAMHANDEHIAKITEMITTEAIFVSGERTRIGILGLSFKANTDDVRDSPAVSIVNSLSEVFENICVFDPMASDSVSMKAQRLLSAEAVIENAEVIAILTEWPEFAEISPLIFANLMNGKTIIDTRYILDVEKFAQLGLTVKSLGRNFDSLK